MGGSSSLRIWCVSTALMVTLALSFAAQYFVTIHLSKPYDAYLALSGYGMKSGHLWELFTYQFLHDGYLHFLVNQAALWFLGRRIEAAFGSKTFLRLYTLGVLVGGVLQGIVAFAGYTLPESMESLASMLRDRYGGESMGASVGLCACLGAWLLKEKSTPMPAGAWIALGLAITFAAIPNQTELPHLAHLGALLTGFVWAKLRK